MDIQPACHDLPILCAVIATEEFRKAMAKQQHQTDDIPTEALKVDIDTSVDMLYPLFIHEDLGENEV